MTELLGNSKSIGESYDELASYIREHKLNDITSPSDERWKDHSAALSKLSKSLLKGFRALDADAFVKASKRPFETAKIAMAFYRYVRDLANYETLGLVKYPKVDVTESTS